MHDAGFHHLVVVIIADTFQYPSNIMFRSASRFQSLSALVLAPTFACLPCLAFSEEYPFDTKGFPTKCVNPVPERAWPNALPLAGVGMRRKNFYVMEVDVYMTAVNLSPQALTNVKANNGSSAVEAILKGTKGEIPQPAVTVVLRFVRDVDSKKVSEAFNEVFAGVAPEKIANFGKQLSSAVGEKGMKTGEEVMFVWMEGGGMKFIKNGVVGGGVMDKEIEHKLLGAYLDPVKAVSPELLACFNANIDKI